MELIDAVKNRRSIHEFEQKQIPKPDLQTLFSQAAWAPTHRMKEPWNLRCYQGEGIEAYTSAVLASYERQGFFSSYEQEKRDKMKTGIERFLQSIPHHVLVYMEREEDLVKYEEDYAAVCAFIQNTQLLAWEKQIGVLWTTSPYLHDPQFASDLQLDPETKKLVAVLQMGYPKRIPKAKARTPVTEKLTFIE
ncbi:nitroreductase [Halobacillus litoralis]|uniref:nitroreductase family protein n=1 Tax=Halobacillus litoralis TaxID=45668 RepID=UPI001CD704F9|nr:nitroreductase [Halobacillus litoralis]MCA0971664.1 nitroreductase [Halobacillus litoralis]